MLRLITPAATHLPACAALYADAFAAPPWNETYNPRELIAYLDDFCHSDARRCYLLTDDNAVIGIALCTVTPCPGGPFLRIEDFCIAPAHQRSGYGSAFMKLIKQEARTLSCDSILLATQRGFPAHDFYRKNGFREIDSVQLCCVQDA